MLATVVAMNSLNIKYLVCYLKQIVVCRSWIFGQDLRKFEVHYTATL